MYVIVLVEMLCMKVPYLYSLVLFGIIGGRTRSRHLKQKTAFLENLNKNWTNIGQFSETSEERTVGTILSS